ncbi:MAG: hypothetical protein IJ035_10560 [Oscillospiraceae bacterium]|nr:hypothetical protein [Oscillospiraceae bacterium]
MKKLIAAVSAIALTFSAAFTAFAAETADVYVTISDGTGAIPLAQEKITVTDVDADGALTINDALFSAHEEHYNGGAAAGYASGETEYGLSLNKLWGVENGGSYGYYVNHASAMSLGDSVADGDYINAYAYSDLTAWSDAYCWFDIDTAELTAGGEIALTLSYAGYDADWNPVTSFVDGAVITVNGEKTSLTTDSQGKVEIKLDEAGEYIISAVSDTQTLVPPVCKVTVTAASSDSTTTAPATGNSTSGLVAVTAIALAAALLTKKNEK